ncbi:dynactin p62 family-domain-containing protein [Amylostereum chailletii]|nr:dynactin p62 family-domain-containing protein [Amylostereum chailletii]
MSPSVQYHCGCMSKAPPPPPHLPSSSARFHPLHELFFCEECDEVRCNRCVTIEVSGYFCPNCLFEVPSASVRAEKNRCARNCFLCPNCRNTLSVVPSDPPDMDDGRSAPVAISAVGEPPFFLYCNHCRWDSAEVGITFEKPTGLAAQLQRFEDSAPESLEFERLKEHFEPFLRAGAASSSSLAAPTPAHSHHHVNPVTAAASSALARDIPGVGKYTPHHSGSRRTKGARDEMADYRARVETGGTSGTGGEHDVEFMSGLEDVSEVASLEQRWANSWATDVKPLRMPLHSKKSKRCPQCRHILIKPEQKAQSVRYKIKLVAANYLPSISAALPAPPEIARRASVPGEEPRALHANQTYPFQLAFTNPLYENVQVRLSVQRTGPPPGTVDATGEKSRRPPFSVSLPTTAFPIAAFAEAWEYEDDEDMFGAEEDEIALERAREGAKRTKTVGVLEKRANVTIVGGEVFIGKEARGEVKFNMSVSYTYRFDDPLGEDDVRSTPSRSKTTQDSMKTFSFVTVVELGPIIPREEVRAEAIGDI